MRGALVLAGQERSLGTGFASPRPPGHLDGRQTSDGGSEKLCEGLWDHLGNGMLRGTAVDNLKQNHAFKNSRLAQLHPAMALFLESPVHSLNKH